MPPPPPSTSGIDSLITASENRAMFDRIAPHYDAANRALSFGLDRRWRRKAVAALAPVAGGRYLDIGTGTGDVAFEILRQAPGARVTGLDPAERMLAIARQKAEALNVADGVAFEVGDAGRLPAVPASVDGVISAFCFRNIAQRKAALDEMRRVLRDDGTLVLLELTYPRQPLMRLCFRLYSLAIPGVGYVAGNARAYRYLVESIEAFLRPGELLGMLEATGFKAVQHRPLSGGVVSIFSARKAVT